MSADRIRSLQDEELLRAIVKKHLPEEPAKTSLIWNTNDMEVLAENYKAFFTAVALTGCRLSQPVLVKVLKAQCDSPTIVLNPFAGKMADALAYSRGKRHSMSSGSKTTAAVKQVLQAYGTEPQAASSEAGESPPFADAPKPVHDVDAVLPDDEHLGSNEEEEQAKKALEQAKAMFASFSSASAEPSSPAISVMSSEGEGLPKKRIRVKTSEPAMAQVLTIQNCLMKLHIMSHYDSS